MNAMPALMNGTLSPYCSVMRVFNMKFFRVELDYRVSRSMRPMNIALWPSGGSIPPQTSPTICRRACRRPRAALAGYVASFRQINHSIGDIFRPGNRAHWRKGHQEVFRDTFDNRGIDSPGRTALKRMLLYAYSFARLGVIAFSPPLVSIEMNPEDQRWGAGPVRP
jgi:hypothetical protein